MAEVKAIVKAGDKAITVDEAKKILGFQSEEESGIEFGDDFFCKLPGYGKIRLKNNQKNRPFRLAQAQKYALELLRKKWRLNGEAIVIHEDDQMGSGQHRLLGLILAEAMRLKEKEKWHQFGTRGPVTMETILVTGVSKKDDVANTFDGGIGRNLGDVIFRSHQFGKLDRKQLSGILSVAARLAWLRTGGKTVSAAGHFPHSEALDFIKIHKELPACCEFIFQTDGGVERNIKSYLTLGYASALMYLMVTAKSKADKFDADGTINTDLEEKAREFWIGFADAKNADFSDLRKMLHGISTGGAEGRDEKCGAIVLAWNAFVDGKDMTMKNIKVPRSKGKIVDHPRMGGLDIVREAPEKEAPEEKSAKAKGKGKKPTGKKPKGLKPEPVKEVEIDTTRKGEMSEEGWEEGDTCWVNQTGADPWYGEIVSFDETGKTVFLTDYDSEEEGQEYEANVKDLSVGYPKKRKAG